MPMLVALRSFSVSNDLTGHARIFGIKAGLIEWKGTKIENDSVYKYFIFSKGRKYEMTGWIYIYIFLLCYQF